MSRLRTAAFATVVSVSALVVLAGPASAHVTASSTDAAQGGYGVVTFRVPNEEASATTTKVQVQLPTDTPFASASVQPIAGWTASRPRSRWQARHHRRRPGHRGRLADHLDGDGRSRDRARSVPAVQRLPGPAAQAGLADVQGHPDLQQRRGRPLDRDAGARLVRGARPPGSGAQTDRRIGRRGGRQQHGPVGLGHRRAGLASSSDDSSSNTGPIVLSIIALVLAAGALGLGVVNRARRSS